MSKFRESLQSSVAPSNLPSQLEIALRERWPNMADALFGVPAQPDGGASIPSCSIILFVEGDRLKYVLTPQGSDRVAFGTISEPLEGFCGLEKSLDAGDYAWRAKKGRR